MIKAVLKIFFILTLTTGFIYPLVITGICQIAFPKQANGSLIYAKNQPVGSLLIGQNFKDPSYFWGRPSASDYSTLPSQGSNLSPTSKKLWKGVQERIDHLQEAHGKERNLPADLVYASASGIDPDVTQEGVLYQLDRIIKARNLTHPQIEKLKAYIELGDRIYWRESSPSYLNLLHLNLTLDQIDQNDH